MSAKHTPGPWEVIDHSWSDASVESGNTRVCFLSILDDATEKTQAKMEAEMGANARLIAAAPDLLEALKGLLKINEDHNATLNAIIGAPPGWKDDYLHAARAAIAKAKGESKP